MIARVRRAALSLAVASALVAGGPVVAIAATPAATSGTPAATPGPAAGTVTTPAPPATTVTVRHTSGDRSAAVVLLVLVGGLLALAALIWAAVSWSAEEPDWMLRARHATGEAGWRLSNTWAEFVDFLRLGR